MESATPSQKPAAVQTWEFAQAAILLLAGGGVLWQRAVAPLVFAALGTFALGIFLNRRVLASLGRFGGPANLVTGFRLMGVLMVGVLWPVAPPIIWAAVALGLVCLDGLDGYLARKTQTASIFGAHFDMETDAFFVYLFTAILYTAGFFGGWILAIGALRYGFVILLVCMGWQDRQEPRWFWARIIAVALMLGLLTPFILPDGVYRPTVIGVSLLVVYSFGRSIFYFLRS